MKTTRDSSLESYYKGLGVEMALNIVEDEKRACKERIKNGVYSREPDIGAGEQLAIESIESRLKGLLEIMEIVVARPDMYRLEWTGSNYKLTFV